MNVSDNLGQRGEVLVTTSGAAFRAPDVRAQAEHVLRTRDVTFAYGRYRGLDGHTAARAVQVLAEAGLLAQATRPAPVAELTPERTELLLRRGLANQEDTVSIAEAGALRLVWCTAAGAFRLTDHTGEHYRGQDTTAAAAAFNLAAAQAVGAATTGDQP